jgi:hypothetical protein
MTVESMEKVPPEIRVICQYGHQEYDTVRVDDQVFTCKASFAETKLSEVQFGLNFEG